MKNYYRKALTACVLAFVLTTPTLAGFMPTPEAPPPPQQTGEIQFPGASSTTTPGEMSAGVTGDIYTGVAEAALSLLQSVLTPF